MEQNRRKKVNTPRVSFRITPYLEHELANLAKAKKCTRSDVVKEAIEMLLKAYSRHIGK